MIEGRSIFEEIRSVAESSHVSNGSAAMFVMTVQVMAMARDIPVNLRPALVQACTRWFAGLDTGSLEPARVECWKFLETKNGNSTTVEDEADVAVRGLICVLWDEPQEDDLDLAVEFFDGLLQLYANLRRSY